MTSHPLYLTLYQCYFFHNIHCIDMAICTFLWQCICVPSQPLCLTLYSVSSTTTQRLYLTWYPMYLHNQTQIISIVYKNIFTIFVPSQPLYLRLTTTLSMISHPLYICHCTHYMFNIKYTIYGFTSRVYDITPHYLWDHMHCIHVITPPISNTASTVSESSQSIYVWSLNNCMYGITPTLYMTSYAPWIMSHPLYEFTLF